MTTYHSKYHNKKIQTPDGIFDSKKEYERWLELKIMERAGVISGLTRQQRFEIIPKVKKQRACYYIADFCYTQGGKPVVEDCKGVRTEAYKIKKKLMLWRYGIEIKET